MTGNVNAYATIRKNSPGNTASVAMKSQAVEECSRLWTGRDVHGPALCGYHNNFLESASVSWKSFSDLNGA